MNLGVAEIAILVVIGAFFIFSRKKIPKEQSGLLTPFEFSNNLPSDNTFNIFSFQNPLNAVFILLIIQGLFYRALPNIFNSYGLTEDYEMTNRVYSICGIVFTILFSIISLKITNKLLRITAILYFAYVIFTSISQLLTSRF